MKKDCNKSDRLYAPRSFGILHLQGWGLLTIIIFPLLTVAVAFSKKHINSDVAIAFGVFTLSGLVIGFLLIYFPHKYRTLLVYQHDTKLLSKIKKGTASQEFSLNNAKVIISKKIITTLGWKYYFIIENNTGRKITIFQEETMHGADHWEAFAEKVACITGLPLGKEYYLKNIDGTLLMKSFDELKEERCYNLVIVSIPIIISLIGAGVCRIYGTSRVFIYAGCVTVAINMLLSVGYLFLNREKLKVVPNDEIVVGVVFYLTLLFPYAFFYVLFCFILNGFRLPL